MYSNELKIFFCLFSLFICVTGKSKVIDLDEDNWHEMLEGEWMVEFFAPWCPACKALKPIWKDFATWSDDLGISVGQVDVTASPGLSGRFMVTALPTIYHIKNGEFRQYRGSRDKEEFMSFVEEKKWESLEIIPAWKSPASYQMSLIAQFFKLSMVLRGVHTSMVDDYGFPAWFSYLAFAIATIIVGALLGLILVCTIDFLFPPKSMQHIPPIPDQNKYKGSDDEDSDDKEKDDGESQEEDNTEEEEEEGDEEEEKEASQEENSEPEANISASNSPNIRKRRARKE